MNTSRKHFLDLRTVAYTVVMLVMIATIIHVVVKDLLGQLPDYDLTSVVVLAMIGGLLILAPFLLFGGNIQSRLSPYPKSEKKNTVPDLRSIYITLALLFVMANLLFWSGIVPQFDLNSVVQTILPGALAMTVSVLSRKKKRPASRKRAGRFSINR